MLSDLGNRTYYILGPHGNLNELPMAEAEAKAEFEMEAALTREETLLAKEMPTPPRVMEGIAIRNISLMI